VSRKVQDVCRLSAARPTRVRPRGVVSHMRDTMGKATDGDKNEVPKVPKQQGAIL
jgi:hypothetical protein